MLAVLAHERESRLARVPDSDDPPVRSERNGYRARGELDRTQIRIGSGKVRSRRSFLRLVGAAPAALAIPALAFEFKAYDPAAVDKAIATGKPVIVHVRAW